MLLTAAHRGRRAVASTIVLAAALATLSCRSDENRALILIDGTIAADVASQNLVTVLFTIDGLSSFQRPVDYAELKNGVHIGLWVANPPARTSPVTIVATAMDGRGCTVGRGTTTAPSLQVGKSVTAQPSLLISALPVAECPPVGGGGGDQGGRMGGTGAGAGGSIGRGGSGGSAGGSTGRGGSGGGGGNAPGTGGARGGAGGGGASGATGGGGSPALSGATSHDFGAIEIGVATAAFEWQITNNGGATGTLQIDNSDPTKITVGGSCPTLAAKASCTLSIVVQSGANAMLMASVTIHDDRASLTLQVTANPKYRVTIVLQGTGTGTITSTPPGINCPTTCTGLFDNEVVTLTPHVSNGSGMFFAGWSPICGVVRNCTLMPLSATNLTATFLPMTSNLVFATAKQLPPNEGGVAAYDAECNGAATAVGINNAAGNGYFAFMSDGNTPPSARVPSSVKGWMRLDGRPFGVLPGLFSAGQVINPIMFAEDGNRGNLAFTGAATNGTQVSYTCLNWTSTASSIDSVDIGDVLGGPGSWAGGASQWCDPSLPQSVICMGKTSQSAPPLPSAPVGSKKVWLSNTPFLVGGAQTPDQKCNAERPAGVTTAAAFVSQVGLSTNSLISMATTYVRPDGAVVGTGAEILGTKQMSLESGIWQSADGTYIDAQATGAFAWTGATRPGIAAAPQDSCNNWTDASTATPAMVGIPSTAGASWWQGGVVGPRQTACNLTTNRIYCVQTAP